MLLFFRAARKALNPRGRIIVSTGCKSFCASEEDLTYASRVSGYKRVDRHSFREWAYKDYERAYGDWRDNDEVVMTNTPQAGTNAQGYRGQVAHNEVVFCFEMVDTDYVDLTLVKPPATDDIAPHVSSCACGLIVPPESIGGHKFG